MSLCERCRVELDDGAERLPPPWFDHDQHLVAGNPLKPMEWRLLEILYRRRTRCVSVDTCMTLLYADRPDDPPDDSIIKAYVCYVRRALDPTPYSIKTTWAVGFQFLDHKWSAEAVVGSIEDNVPPPPPTKRDADKYGFRLLQPGQSRRVENSRLETLQSICGLTNKKGFGLFKAGVDAAGAMRIWRLK